MNTRLASHFTLNMTLFSDYIAPFILAILQGITEFLPVSSSGHLVLLNQFMDVDKGIVFDLVLHLATLISVVAFYWRDIVEICVGGVHEIKTKGDKSNLKFVGYLIVATFITGVIGLTLNDLVETKFRNIIVVGVLLIANSAILMASKKAGLFSITKDERLSLKSAMVIGIVQGLAVLPGISRSGSTITAALLMGIEKKDCAKISFLLSIPVILGAVILHLKDLSSFSSDNLIVIGLAAAVAAVVGYLSLVLLNKLLQKANFHYFAPYCLIVGILAICVGLFI